MLIQFGLWSLVMICGFLACICLLSGDILVAILFSVLTAIYVCFVTSVQDRIPFAAANLRCATTAINKHSVRALRCTSIVPRRPANRHALF